MKTLSLTLLLLLAPTAAHAATFAEAQAAYGLFDVTKAEALYRDVAADPTAPAKDRAAATRELARIAWLVDGQRDKARSMLAASLPNDPDPCPAAHLAMRISNDAAVPPASDAAAARLAAACLETEPGVALEGIRTLERRAASRPAAERRAAAAEALRRLAKLPGGARDSMLGARLQLSLGILADDAEAALLGWRRYFWLEPGVSAPQALSGNIEPTFRAGLASSPPRPAALRFAALLMRAGFDDELRGYADRHRLARAGDDAWKPLGIYIELRDALAREILAHDRKYARSGATEEAAYEQRLTGILTRAARQLGAADGPPIEALHRAFGLWGTMPGKTNGVSGIHLGHTVVDERQKVAQDGRTGEIRFIALDNMVHNSFSAWLMDGASAPGGWAVDGATIVQVRPRYLMLIDGYARLARPGPARDRALAEAAAERRGDRAIAAATPIAFLPGVRSRLRLGGIDAIAANVRRSLAPGDSFEIAFKRAYLDALVTSAITAHEGRHVLDQASFKAACELANPELEYRAKLSEIRFAPSPRLAMSSIYSPLFGGTSGHGIANRRLATDFANWIGTHPDQVAGYDAALTPLEQLDKLSDEQFRQVATSLEPPSSSCRSS
jgi:hypothetical protein